MRYLAPCAILFSITVVNAETVSTSSTSANTNLAVNNTFKIQQTTQSVARKLVTILELTTVPDSELNSISLKSVVIKALGEGKPMSEIRLATNQAVKEVTGKTLTIAKRTNTPSKSTSAAVSVVTTIGQARPGAIIADPTEISLDPETGNMVATVLPGESIFRLAQRVYGKENGRKYLEIYEANRDKIKNINVVVEGQVLTMPQ